MRRLAIFVVRRRWWVIGIALIALPAAAAYGANVHDELAAGGFFDPGAESTLAKKAIVQEFPLSSQSDFAIVVTTKNGKNVNDPAVQAAGEDLTARLGREPGVLTSSSYWSLNKVPQLHSRDSRQALIFATLLGTDDQKLKTSGRLSPLYNVDNAVISTDVTGEVEVTRQISHQAEKDLARADLLTAPLTFVALVVVFGSLVAAGLPLAVGILAVLGTFVVLKALAQVTDVSVFSLNLTTGMGLGLAIDYSLFVVSRYREELGRGVSAPVAVGRSMQTAGHTVAFSAGTVAISLAVLAIFPMPYLRSFSYAGVAVVALAAIASIVVLPSVLAVLGPRIEKGRLFKVRETTDGGFWRHQADRVMRHPVPYALAVSLVLILLAIPFFHLNVGLPDDRVGPKSMTSRAATDAVRHNFATREADALQVRIPDVDVSKDKTAIDAFAKKIEKVPGVVRIDAVTGFYGDVLSNGKHTFIPPELGPKAITQRFIARPGQHGTYLSVVPDVEPFSSQGEKLVKDIRATSAPFKFEVAGLSAQLVDTKHAVISRLPIALGFIALATFVLLFMMTGSILVPVKALVLNMLSLTATFGATVWIFQDGHLSNLLGFTPTGTIDVFTPILMFCIAFGLSMDYEVFLLSRIKEEYDLEHDNEHAVAIGLAKTGRIVTAAALLLTIVFFGIATSQVALLKAFGIGLGLAVLVDAFLIRATLVPAFMRMAGRVNWWSPKWLRRWHLRFGIWENEPIALLDRQFESSV
ncbi:MAG: MMPL family transporter [Actinomycetota bacterium]